MRIQTSTFALAACLLASISTLGGCAYGNLRQVLRTQVATETDCAETKVVERQLYDGGKSNEYEVSGCGELRRYVCPADPGLVSYDEQVCTLSTDGNKPKLAAMGDGDVLPGEAAPDAEETVDEETDNDETVNEETANEETVNEETAADESTSEDSAAE